MTHAEAKDEPCQHLNFKAEAKITRLTDEEGGEVNGYRAEIEVHCADCFMPFTFVGLPGGYSPSQPTVNFDCTELRAPLKPVIL